MDEYYNVKRLALVLSKQAEIEGMKAENLHRQNSGEAVAYRMEDFEIASIDLINLAYAHNEQL
jgi:hypothetical protein